MVINTNVEAQRTANNLNVSQTNLAKSLSRLSSGSRIVNPSDDAAGLAVSSRLRAQIKRLDSALSNVVNAVSFTQTQDGFMKTVDKAFRRMGELAMLARDETKSAADRALYDQEFQQLKDYVIDSTAKEFNSVALFDGADIAVTIDSEGETFDMAGIDMTATNYTDALFIGDAIKTQVATDGTITSGAYNTAVPPVFVAGAHGLTTGDIVRLNPTDGSENSTTPAVSGATDYYVCVVTANTYTIHPTLADAMLGATTPADATNEVTFTGAGEVDFIDYNNRVNITTASESETALEKVRAAISQVAQDRAALGAVQSRLNFTNEQLSVTKENLSSAISRIADVDVAEEATQYARYQILVQSGTSMLQQANQLPQAALQLLRG
jgi:flagellin